ncbi:hypothetical protein [Streptomyces griseocarneus]|uniref:hypothetical protein n=1 Tax=Streptomyces griseocarneus TaxID=51201 RepID=UPI001F618B26|nr:hypothetical protein [Streptomyces griseocarneus]
MRDLSVPYVEVDGRAVDAGPLLSALMGSYGHMTAMQVREGRVRGLDFHLERLDAATREMFGEGMDGGGVRDGVRRALGGAGSSTRTYASTSTPWAASTPARPRRWSYGPLSRAPGRRSGCAACRTYGRWRT